MDQDIILVSSILFGGAIVVFMFIVAALVFSGPVEEGAVRTFPQLKAGAEEHAGHPTEQQYVMIGVILALITALEVGLYYITGIPNGALVPMLLILSAGKFLLVVMWFMHLRFDNRLFSTLFTMGFTTAVIVYILALFTLRALLPGDLD
jgi:cytochrome c oxidase subunit 4